MDQVQMARTSAPTRQALVDHVHTATCAEHGCPTLWLPASRRDVASPRRFIRRVVVAAASGLIIATSWAATAAASSGYMSTHAC